jgi:CelD/BcsL family acetyltransferase involved in cellulose biosynthesis
MLDAGQFAVRAASGPEDVDRIVALWVRRWGAQKGARIGELQADLRRILAAGLRSRSLSVPILEREGRMLGALANYVDTVRGEILFFLAVRDAEAERASTGLLLHAEAIRAAIGAGFRVYDFLRGDEPYKLQLGGVPERIHFPIITRVKAAAPHETLAAASARSVLRHVEDMISQGDMQGASAAIAQLRAVL